MMIEALGRTLALELAAAPVEYGLPGFINTEALEGSTWRGTGGQEELRAKATSDLLTARAGIPDDAAKSYLYAICNPYVAPRPSSSMAAWSLT